MMEMDKICTSLEEEVEEKLIEYLYEWYKDNAEDIFDEWKEKQDG